ncbi:hypothetical protein LA345_12980 [Burkholderia vietnamiensis]|uniref:Uncharacterized protein n=1 Tax=Burkholderia vietnamiensis (strain G4 / LMG 22486) TaxID=269482 RepID=A4JFL2_BURVG|nr:hypothetical protein Bcep1808_2063 [Burkholderia vietnamiensis G4]MCB4344826.1 hypothetical protein [Burkholderia vietnamiensis]
MSEIVQSNCDTEMDVETRSRIPLSQDVALGGLFTLMRSRARKISVRRFVFEALPMLMAIREHLNLPWDEIADELSRDQLDKNGIPVRIPGKRLATYCSAAHLSLDAQAPSKGNRHGKTRAEFDREFAECSELIRAAEAERKEQARWTNAPALPRVENKPMPAPTAASAAASGVSAVFGGAPKSEPPVRAIVAQPGAPRSTSTPQPMIHADVARASGSEASRARMASEIAAPAAPSGNVSSVFPRDDEEFALLRETLIRLRASGSRPSPIVMIDTPSGTIKKTYDVEVQELIAGESNAIVSAAQLALYLKTHAARRA